MPYNVASWYVTFGGPMPGGEEWHCGLHINADGDVSSQAAAQAVADAMVEPLQDFYNSNGISTLTSVGTDLSECRVYGRLAGQTSAASVAFSQPGATGDGTPRCPNQVALVASLRTDDPSRKGRARIYLPATAAQIASFGQLETGTAGAVAASVAQLIEDIAAVGTIGVVMGGTSGRPVNTVVVDTILDTQRRRRNQIQLVGQVSSPANQG